MKDIPSDITAETICAQNSPSVSRANEVESDTYLEVIVSFMQEKRDFMEELSRA